MPPNSMKHIVVHYAEIALKGRNRPVFEKQLVANIKEANRGEKLKVEREHGRIVVELAESSHLSAVSDNLKNVFGIAHFSPCIIAKADIDDIRIKAKELAKSLKMGKKTTFRIDATRSDKSFPLTSQKINEMTGDVVNEETGWAVKLSNPDLTIYVEVANGRSFIYTEKIEGLGGLPVGSSGHAVCLLSGGIDSPVAAWYMMKRGCTVTFVHFHTYTSKIEEKIQDIVKVLNRFQFSSRVYYVPFFETQEKIIESISPDYRIVVFRKFMTRFAEEIAKRENAMAIITGDNVGQVASQTLENMRIIHASKYPIMAPLIGFDKKEIIKAAERIGTYKFSILPYKDCCSALVAKHPETRGRLEDISEIEKLIDVQHLVENSLKKVEVVEVKG